MAGSAFKPLVLFLAGVATVGTFDELASLKFAVRTAALLACSHARMHARSSWRIIRAASSLRVVSRSWHIRAARLTAAPCLYVRQVLPATLTCLQSLLLPVLARVFASALCASDRAQAFAFAYGILPCANAFLVVAQAYDVAPPMQAMVASYLALGKIVAYPVRAPPPLHSVGARGRSHDRRPARRE